MGWAMKLNQRLLLGVAAIGVAVLLSSSCNAWDFGEISSGLTPLPEDFPSPSQEGAIEIKQYPAYNAITVPMSGNSHRGLTPSLGMSSNDIHPVATPEGEPFEEAVSVLFIYFNHDIVPQEIRRGMSVGYMPPMTVVSIGTRGSYNFETYQANIQRLNAWLMEHPEYTIVGEPLRIIYDYDDPFWPDHLLRSDVEIPIQLIGDGLAPSE